MNVEEDLTPEQLDNFTVHYVKTIDEALRFSLPQVEKDSAVVSTPVKEPKVARDKVLAQA